MSIRPVLLRATQSGKALCCEPPPLLLLQRAAAADASRM